MTCREVQPDLPLLAGGDLDDRTQVRALRRHVAGCAECKARFVALKASLQTLSSVGPADASATSTWEGRSSLWPAIRRELARPPAGWTAAAAFRQARDWAPFAALTAACAVMLISLGRFDAPQEPPVATRGVGLQPPMALQTPGHSESESASASKSVAPPPQPPVAPPRF